MRILQNCRVYRSAKFFTADHRLVVDSLKLPVKSERISTCNLIAFLLAKLKDLACSHEYVVTVSSSYNVLSTLEIIVEVWHTLKETQQNHQRGALKNA